jgi:subtilisin-like proprotein convertase family protein
MANNADQVAAFSSRGPTRDGRVNLDAVLAPPRTTEGAFSEITPGLRTGEVYTTDIDVKSAAIPLRVVMAYSDYPGSVLVNNLNLILITPDGQRFVGNQISGSSLTMDVKNNVEVIHIPNPSPGSWTLQVVGSNIPHGPQEFALVYLAHLSGEPKKEVIYQEAAPDLAVPDDNAKGVNSIIPVSQGGIIGNLKRLNGKSASGDWQLTVSDHAGIDTGRLRRWDLAIQLASTRHIEQESTASIAIPDNDPKGASDSIDIVTAGHISDVNVWVDITHTWVGDLQVRLTAPSGSEILLHDRSGGSQDNLIKTYSQENLTAMKTLIGQSAQGTWILRVLDLAGRDIGKLNRWGLKLTL